MSSKKIVTYVLRYEGSNELTIEAIEQAKIAFRTEQVAEVLPGILSVRGTPKQVEAHAGQLKSWRLEPEKQFTAAPPRQTRFRTSLPKAG